MMKLRLRSFYTKGLLSKFKQVDRTVGRKSSLCLYCTDAPSKQVNHCTGSVVYVLCNSKIENFFSCTVLSVTTIRTELFIKSIEMSEKSCQDYKAGRKGSCLISSMFSTTLSNQAGERAKLTSKSIQSWRHYIQVNLQKLQKQTDNSRRSCILI